MAVAERVRARGHGEGGSVGWRRGGGQHGERGGRGRAGGLRGLEGVGVVGGQPHARDGQVRPSERDGDGP